MTRDSETQTRYIKFASFLPAPETAQRNIPETGTNWGKSKWDHATRSWRESVKVMMMNIFIVLYACDSSWQVPLSPSLSLSLSLSPGNCSWQSLTNRAWLTFQTSQTLKHFYSYSATCGEQLRRSHQPNIQTLKVFWKRNATSWSDQVVMENCKSLQWFLKNCHDLKSIWWICHEVETLTNGKTGQSRNYSFALLLNKTVSWW